MITENLETLKLKSLPVKEEELQDLITCLENDFAPYVKYGVGLSAIQVNIPKRVSIIRIKRQVKVRGDKRTIEKNINLYNAEIIEKSQRFTYKGEGCLSFPGQFDDTVRYNHIKVKNGDGEVLTLSGFEAVAVQHEIDHWDGIVFTDRVIK